MSTLKLYAVKNWGSKIVELTFELTGLSYQAEYLNPEEVKTPQYQKLNPLMQIPTLVLPSGEIMTESLAICLYVNAQGNGNLAPREGDSDYARFLRWSVFLVGSIYSLAPTADHPDWFVREKSAQDQLQEESMKRVKERLLLMEHEVKGPWFLGERLSVIDLFLAVMSDWQPGRKWFQENCPKMMKSVYQLEDRAELKDIFERNRVDVPN